MMTNASSWATIERLDMCLLETHTNSWHDFSTYRATRHGVYHLIIDIPSMRFNMLESYIARLYEVICSLDYRQVFDSATVSLFHPVTTPCCHPCSKRLYCVH